MEAEGRRAGRRGRGGQGGPGVGVGPAPGDEQRGGAGGGVAVEDGLFPSGVGALQQGAEAVAGLGFGQVGQGEGSLALGVGVGALLVAVTSVEGPIVHALHLDDVVAPQHSGQSLCPGNATGGGGWGPAGLLQDGDPGGDAELRDGVRG